jgi:hypothetical protein
MFSIILKTRTTDKTLFFANFKLSFLFYMLQQVAKVAAYAPPPIVKFSGFF